MKSKQIIIVLLSFIILFSISCKNNDKTGSGDDYSVPTATGDPATDLTDGNYTGTLKRTAQVGSPTEDQPTLDGFSAPIYALQEFEMCPFNITLFGALVITFVLRLVFLLMFTFLVTAVSSFCKNDIISMVVSVAAGFLLVIGSELLPGVLNPTTLVGPTELFTNMNVCNILDFPIFNVVVTLSEVILLAVVFAVVSVRRGMKCC